MLGTGPWMLTNYTPSASFTLKRNAEYWDKTRDWRGRTSFFRAGYNYTTSTQNFNHTAAMGALLSGRSRRPRRGGGSARRHAGGEHQQCRHPP